MQFSLVNIKNLDFFFASWYEIKTVFSIVCLITRGEMTSFDLWRFIFYNNLVTWSHVTTCDYLVTVSHMESQESQESQVVTLVTVEVKDLNNDGLGGYYGFV